MRIEQMGDVVAATEELIAHPPALHFTAEGERCWSVGEEVLRWPAANVRPECSTIEPGCGHSSIVFMLAGAAHAIVAPHEPAHVHDFLRAGSERWEYLLTLGKTAVFRKRSDVSIPPTVWCDRPSVSAEPDAGATGRLRRSLRPRTRLPRAAKAVRELRA